MGKLQKQLNRRVGDKEYYKYSLVIPQEVIDEMNWEGQPDLVFEMKDGAVIIECKSCRTTK